MSARSEEIVHAMLEEFKAHDIVDTPAHRRDFLTGLRDGWHEDPSTSIEKSMYLIAIEGLIFTETLKATSPFSQV